MQEQRSQTWLWAGAILILSVIAIAAVYFWPQPVPPPEPPRAAAPTAASAPPTMIETPAQPEPTPAPPAEPIKPLPALAQSDALAIAQLSQLIGSGQLPAWLKTDRLITRFVVLIDNLPRKKLALSHTPLSPIGGTFAVEPSANGQWHPSAANAQRYAPYVALIERIDMGQAAAAYQQLAPLFQSAYEQLGYPNARFHARLIEVIDHLLETPEPASPPVLVQPKVLYEYADQDLQSRSAGQKLMLRTGPETTRRLKAQLRKLRAQLSEAQASVGSN